MSPHPLSSRENNVNLSFKVFQYILILKNCMLRAFSLFWVNACPLRASFPFFVFPKMAHRPTEWKVLIYLLENWGEVANAWEASGYEPVSINFCLLASAKWPGVGAVFPLLGMPYENYSLGERKIRFRENPFQRGKRSKYLVSLLAAYPRTCHCLWSLRSHP